MDSSSAVAIIKWFKSATNIEVVTHEVVRTEEEGIRPVRKAYKIAWDPSYDQFSLGCDSIASLGNRRIVAVRINRRVENPKKIQ